MNAADNDVPCSTDDMSARPVDVSGAALNAHAHSGRSDGFISETYTTVLEDPVAAVSDCGICADIMDSKVDLRQAAINAADVVVVLRDVDAVNAVVSNEDDVRRAKVISDGSFLTGAARETVFMDCCCEPSFDLKMKENADYIGNREFADFKDCRGDGTSIASTADDTSSQRRGCHGCFVSSSETIRNGPRDRDSFKAGEFDCQIVGDSVQSGRVARCSEHCSDLCCHAVDVSGLLESQKNDEFFNQTSDVENCKLQMNSETGDESDSAVSSSASFEPSKLIFNDCETQCQEFVTVLDGQYKTSHIGDLPQMKVTYMHIYMNIYECAANVLI